ncbi:hypothetical protein SLEP1_g20167 [Rubroshorea leprosula]|uniref:Uncharacterized protein n=1 Tax=Rubroshorea leprosula TaxID=152421 RepID=A0AAV5J1T4_9ROSI|nr:hypothetical protein SLEP1_g20167 [Rubroshorea leprosula]
MRSMSRCPKRNRRKAKDESKKFKKGKLIKLSKYGFVYTCRVCGEQRHNKVGCPYKDKEEADPNQTKATLLLHFICAMLLVLSSMKAERNPEKNPSRCITNKVQKERGRRRLEKA